MDGRHHRNKMDFMLTTGFWLLTSRKTARFCKWLYGFSSIPAPSDLSDESDLSDKTTSADPLIWEKSHENRKFGKLYGDFIKSWQTKPGIVAVSRACKAQLPTDENTDGGSP
jgi:hypothetical protein